MEEGAVDLGIPGLTDAVEVARGGFSTIYRATQRAMERTVAVKLIHATVVDPVAGEHFLREVRATGRLSQHPNVAPVYDVGTTASAQPYLIMPYYEHGSLQRHLDANGALSERDAVHLARTLASTLDYVHQRGILHRDIKPANVLLTEADEPLLADFGVARLVDGSVPVHTTGANVVTWAYGPPEAFTGGDPTPAWDIYSLGATVYAMLTGNPPFVDGEDVNVFTVLNRIGNVEVPDLRDRGVSAPVADAVRMTMAKDPSERPETGAAFAALLARPLPPPRPVPVVEPVAMAAPLGSGVEAVPVAPEPVVPVEPVVEPAPVPEPVADLQPEPDAPFESVSEPEPEPVAAMVDPGPALRPAPEPDAAMGPEPVTVEPEPVPADTAADAAVVGAGGGAAGAVAGRVEGVPPGAGAAGADPTSGAPARSPRLIDVVTLLGAAAVILNVIAMGKYVFQDYGSMFDGGLLPDIDTWAATVGLVVGLVLLRVRRGVGYEWLVGAGASFVLLELGIHFIFLNDVGGPYNNTFLILRAAAGALALAVVALSWSPARVPGPRIGFALGAPLVVGAVLAVYGAQQYAAKVGYEWYAWTAIALVVVLLLRAFAFPNRTTGAPALVVAGTVAVIAGLAEGAWQDWDSYKRGSILMLTAGAAIIAAVGAIRWMQSRGAPDAAPAESRPAPSRHP